MDTGSLVEAIRDHRAVQLVYKPDGGSATRLVHPHVMYRARNGRLCLEGVQVAGFSSSGDLPSWKRFQLMNIVSLHVQESRFEPAVDFAPNTYGGGVIASA
jgi:WYL domain-containing protein